MNSLQLARRDLLRISMGGALGISSCGWLPALAQQLATEASSGSRSRRRQCILLWMAGGPSQIDTFDMKPDHGNGGEFREIATRSPGLRISEHLPLLAEQTSDLAVVRSVSTREGDHQRGTYLMRTGRRPGTPVRYPCIGSSLAKSLHNGGLDLPPYLSINPAMQIAADAFSPGFLGPKYAAATVGGTGPSTNGEQDTDDASNREFAELRVDNLTPTRGRTGADAGAPLQIWKQLQADFMSGRKGSIALDHDAVYNRAIDMMNSRDVEAFDLSREPDRVRRRYGPGRFGQGCLLARRLIERGVPIVEVTLGEGLAWDTHQNNFDTVKQLSQQLDRGWGTLMEELKERGLLESTTILWMGEFGRTPLINGNAGRDHFPDAWTCVFAGGGIQGGQAYGQTSDDGRQVVSGKVTQADVLATLCVALGVDPSDENVSPEGRPHRIAEGIPIRDILA